MEYISPISQQFSYQQEQPPPLNKNQRRLQLRHSLSNKTIPQISTFDNDEEHVILKSRQRSSSVSSKESSNHSHYTSPFDDYEEYGVFQEYADHERSKPSTPVDDILPDASPLRLGGSAASTMRKNGRKGLRKASFYSEASTLVSDGFGDLMVLSSQSIVGPRFYESGSGSGSDHGGSKRERGSSSVMASNKRRATARGKITMGNHHNIYTTPPRDRIVQDTPDHSSQHMHPEDATRYIEDLEQQNQDLTAQLHNLTSPTSTASNVAKLKKLTQENRALKDEIAEWQTSFDDKVKEECRKRIIANEMDARARVRAMEQTLEETRETVKILHADIDRLNTIIEEVAHERDMAEKEKREMELKVEVLTEMLRAREGESRSASRCSSRAGGRHDGGGRYSQGSYSGSVMAALRRSGPGRPLSIGSSQFDDSEGEENGYAEHPSVRSGSPTQEPGMIQSKKRMTRSFERGSLPQPLVLPTTMGISQPHSPDGSRPTSSHSNAHPISLYGGGIQANASNISIDSGRTPSVRSGMSAIVRGNSLFAELSMLDDGMSDGVSHRDDASEYSRLHSRVPSYTSFARQHHRGPSIITSPVAATPRIRSPTPIHSQLRSPIRSPILAPSAESTPVPQLRPISEQRPGIFSTLTSTSSGPLHLVADALTRYRIGKFIIAVGRGLRSPKVTLYTVKTKACEVAVKVLTREIGPKKRRKVWNQRSNAWNEERNCSRCSGYERGRKISKSARRSVSAPIPSRVSNLRLSPGTPIEGSREPSLARDRSASRRPGQHHRKRRVSTTSKQQGPEPVRRQHRVHAGDSVWVWVRFLVAIVVTLGVVGNKNEKEDEKARYDNEKAGYHDVAITDDDEDNYSDYLEEVDDEEDTAEIKVERWRRERERAAAEANR